MPDADCFEPLDSGVSVLDTGVVTVDILRRPLAP